MVITQFASYDLWFYGGILLMAAAGLFFAAQAVFYLMKKAGINKKMDAEYGQPQKYHTKEKG